MLDISQQTRLQFEPYVTFIPCYACSEVQTALELLQVCHPQLVSIFLSFALPAGLTMTPTRRIFRVVDGAKTIEELREPPSGNAAVGNEVGKAHPVNLRCVCVRTEDGAEVVGGGGVRLDTCNKQRHSGLTNRSFSREKSTEHMTTDSGY